MENSIFKIRSIKSNIQPLIIPITIIFVVVILLIIAAPMGYSRISESLSTLDDYQTQESKLEEKLVSLREIRNEILPQTSNTVLSLPDRNPVLYKYNVIKSVNESFPDISLLGMTSNKNRISEGGIDTMAIKVEYSGGNFDQIIEVLERITNTIPYTTISEFTLSTQQGFSYLVTYNVYWSQLPETITNISDPVTSLNSDDLSTLEYLSSLGRPAFTSLEYQSYPDRTNPFR